MRQQSRDYLGKLLSKYSPTKVLEVGSLDVNGTIRDQMKGIDFTGSDMRPGTGVDVVVNGHELLTKFKKDEFDLVISFDTFEHDDKFWLTLDQMKKVLKTGGYIVLGFPSRRCPEHDHPHDYWRFMPQSALSMLEGYEDFDLWVDKDEHHSDTEDEIYCYGRKPL